MTDANTLLEDAAKAILYATCDHYGDPRPENPDLSLTNILARAALRVAIEAAAKLCDRAAEALFSETGMSSIHEAITEIKTQREKANRLEDHAEKLTAKLAKAREGLKEIGCGYYSDKDAPKRLDECVDIARAALKEIGE
jgi:hypothetical protein